jgi:hypothetical protein
MEYVVIICMYISAVANSVMLQLYLWNDFYNIIFKMKHKLYTASGTKHPPPPPEKNSGCAPGLWQLIQKKKYTVPYKP